MNCPGSVALCATLPKPPSSPAAQEGIDAHDLLEKCLKNPKISVFDLTENEEMAEAVAYAIDYVRAELNKGGTLLVEQRSEIFPGVMGRLDVAIVRPYDRVVVIDFKYGKGVLVSAVDNPQMLLYSLPVVRQHEVNTVELVILQPRVDEAVSKWECTPEYLETFEKEALRKIEITKEKDAPTVAGKWCRWCYAKAICPALRKDIADNLPAVKGKELILPDTKILTQEHVVKVLTYKETIEKWLDAVAAYAYELVEAGAILEDETGRWELVPKRANRRWRDEKEALAAFADLGAEAFKVKVLSPAQMEKIAGKERVAELTEIPDTGTTLKKVGKK